MVEEEMKEWTVDIQATLEGRRDEAVILEETENFIVTDLVLTDSTRIPSERKVSVTLDGLMQDIVGHAAESDIEPETTDRVYFMAPDDTAVAELEQQIRDELQIEAGEHADRIVLGEPQMRLLRGYLMSAEDAPASVCEWFGLDEVIEVPGPMIHAP